MTRRLHAADLDARSFADATRGALFAAVLENDVDDGHAHAPASAPLDFEGDALAEGFALSRSLWREGVDRRALAGLADTLLRTGDLEASERKAFKHARARFKHLRFAFVLYDEAHRCPPLFKAVTTSLGRLQDAFRVGRLAAVRRHAALLRAAATPGAYALIAGEADRLRPETGPGFRAFVRGEIARLRALAERSELTSARFHAARKIVSRQVSFYDDMRVLAPSPDLHAMSRVLAAANGAMGAFHDALVEARARGEPEAAFPWPCEMREDLLRIANLYPVSAPARRHGGGAAGRGSASA